MLTCTVNQILEQARFANGSLGDGVTMTADEISDDMLALNLLLASWDITLYATTQETKALTASQASYTWGTGGNINTDRPLDFVDQTFIRSGDVDYPIKQIMDDEYNSISNKTITGMPSKILYDPSYALAVISFYPVPDSTYTVYLTSVKALTPYTDSTSTISLSQEFLAALKWNMALELSPNYNVPITPLMMQRAQQTKSVILNRAFKYKISPARIDNVTGECGFGIRASILS